MESQLSSVKVTSKKSKETTITRYTTKKLLQIDMNLHIQIIDLNK